MFRSIRWTLQMWHAAILATVLIVFGWVVFYLEQETTYQQIDDGLHRMADLVAAGLRPVFARGPNDRGPGGQNGRSEGPASRKNAARDCRRVCRRRSSPRKDGLPENCDRQPPRGRRRAPRHR